MKELKCYFVDSNFQTLAASTKNCIFKKILLLIKLTSILQKEKAIRSKRNIVTCGSGGLKGFNHCLIVLKERNLATLIF